MTNIPEKILEFIRQWLAQQLGHAASDMANFAALGLDSLDAVELTDALAAEFGLGELPVSIILDHPSATELAQALAIQ